MGFDITSDEAKALIEAGKYVVEPFLGALISSKVEKMTEWLKGRKKRDISDDLIESTFRDYLTRAYISFNQMNILVFPNQQIDIKSIYVPLSICSYEKGKNYLVNEVDFEYIELYKKIVISDTAGMGKSTLTKWIALSLIEKNISIPIIVELRHLNKEYTLLDNISDQINGLNSSVDKDIILNFLNSGYFTILLDGFDEIESMHKVDVIRDLKKFISRAKDNWYILTSRPESSLVTFGDFQSFEIERLREEQSYELLKKYDQVSKFGISDTLIADIQNKGQVKEFLINPFLTSLLYKTYTYNKDIPSKKSSFYEEVYSALYKHHDLSKDGFRRDKKSGLDMHDFKLILRRIAWESAKLVKIEFSEQELVHFVNDAKHKNSGLSFSAVDYVEDLESSVPLFIRLGIKLKWAHKSLQDYFAAEFIVNSIDREKVYNSIYNTKKDSYINIIDFLYEQDYRLFRKTFINPIITDYIEYCDNSYQNLKSDLKEIAVRKGITFDQKFAFISCEMSNDNNEAYVNNILKKHFNKKFDILFPMELKNKKIMLVMQTNSFKRRIIMLLQSKGEDLFVSICGITREEAMRISKNLISEDPIIIDDDPKNVANSRRNFSISNKIIVGRRPPGYDDFILDYDKCVSYKLNIDEEIHLDSTSDDLNGI